MSITIIVIGILTVLFVIFVVIPLGSITLAIKWIKNQISMYRYYIVRGAFIAWSFAMIVVIITQLVRQEGILAKIFGALFFGLIAGLYLLFDAGIVGGVIGWAIGKRFGESNRPDPKTDAVIDRIRIWGLKK